MHEQLSGLVFSAGLGSLQSCQAVRGGWFLPWIACTICQTEGQLQSLARPAGLRIVRIALWFPRLERFPGIRGEEALFARMQARNADSSFVEGGVAEGFILTSLLQMITNDKKKKTFNISLLQLRMNALVISWNFHWFWETGSYFYVQSDTGCSLRCFFRKLWIERPSKFLKTWIFIKKKMWTRKFLCVLVWNMI